MKPLASKDRVESPTGDASDHELTAERTYHAVSSRQLRALGEALEFEECERVIELQQFLFAPWGEKVIPDQPAYPSFIGDDHSPYEYSLAFAGDSVELRILFEAQADTPTPRANQEAARAVNERLAERFKVELSRFERIEDLFLVDDPRPPLSLWHAVCLNSGQPPAFKIYLNPAAQGREQAPALVTEALGRLGMSRVCEPLLQHVVKRGGGMDELRYFSLDLSAHESARVKLYFVHHNASANELERIFSFARSHRRGDVESFCRNMVGHSGPFSRKAVTSCFSFVQGRDEPSSVTLHLPIAHYLTSDQGIAQNVATFLSSQGAAADRYSRALSALAQRPLESSAGIQSYASYRREVAGLRLTVYLSPELFDDASFRSGVRRAG